MLSKYLFSILIIPLMISEATHATHMSDLVLKLAAEASPVKGPKEPQKSGLTPKKGEKIAFGLQSPYKVLLKPKATIDNKAVTIIDSDIKDFSKGRFAYAELFTAYSEGSFMVDADEAMWEQFAQEFVAEYLDEADDIVMLEGAFDILEFGQLLINLSHLVLDNIDILFNDLTLDGTKEQEAVCSHHATYCALLFSKIIKLLAPPSWSAFIQVVKAKSLKTGYTIESGHAWNLVTVEAGKEIYRWHLDAYNHNLIKLDNTGSIKKLRVISFEDSEEIHYSALVDDEFQLLWVSHTQEKYINNHQDGNIYNPENKAKLNTLLENLLAVNNYSNLLTKKPILIQRPAHLNKNHAGARRKLFSAAQEG